MSGLQQIMLPIRRPKVLTYLGESSDTANTDVYTFSGESLGTAAGDRRIIVGVMGDGSAASTISSVTVAGVSADIIVQKSTTNLTCGIVIAAVPTGTSGDIVVTFSVGKLNAHIGVWGCTGLTANTAIDSDSSAADPGTATLTSVIGGFCVALATGNQPTTLTWTGVTEDYDVQIGASATASGASGATSGTTIAPSGDYASGAGALASVFATW